MKLLFVTGLYPKKYIEYFRDQSYGNVQNAPNSFQWAVIDGLEKNGVDYSIVSYPFIPSFPINYKSPYTQSFNIEYEGKLIGRSARFCTVLALKVISIQRSLERYIASWLNEIYSHNSDEKVIVLTYSDYSPFLNAVRKIKAKYPKVILASIITDMPDDMMHFSNNKHLIKRIQCHFEAKKVRSLHKYIDKFILLTSAMTERIPESYGNYCVVEGIAIPKEWEDSEQSTVLKSVLYAGTLQEFSGVRELIKAFTLTTSKDYRLVICGKGALTSFIEDAARHDERIVYKGMVSHEEVLKLQSEATVLINPRTPDCIITRYSFPSKTMEYLISGTPMIGYKLEGMPDEYFNYFYTIDELGIKSLSNKLDEVLSLSSRTLNLKAFEAYNFIMENKTSAKQVAKILDFIKK